MLNDLNQIQNETNKINIIFGSGKKGSEALEYLRSNDVEVHAFCDNDEKKWGKEHCGLHIWSIDELYNAEKNSVRIFIGCMDFISISKQLRSAGFTNFYNYYNNSIYNAYVEMDNLEKLKLQLETKQLYIYGISKFQEDFEYVFDQYDYDGYISNEFLEDTYKGKKVYHSKEFKTIYNSSQLIIICDYDKEKSVEELTSKGFVENRDFIVADNLFGILDMECNKPVGILPSQMMNKTVYSKPENQKDCQTPFIEIRVGTLFSAHCCCTDWTLPIGNLRYNTLDDIWSSINAKIFRLSVINKTYCFCNHERCVLLKKNAETTDKRMDQVSVPKYPAYFEIGIDKTCNYFCGSCRKDLIVMKKEQLDEIEIIKKKIIDSKWLENVNKLMIGGSGEPLFSKIERDLIYCNKGRRKSIFIRTNASLLDKEAFEQLEEIYDKIGIIVSIDAATEGTYLKLRRSNLKNSWENLNRNLQMLSDKKMEKRLGLFQINMCTQMDNYMEIPQFIEMGIKYHVDKVYITPIRNIGTFTDKEFSEISIYNPNKIVKDEVAEILKNPVVHNPIVRLVF